ncbi:MAG: type II toxin-antitoxin system PemK/MazF family toxin [Lachnospira sp.]
MCNIGIMLGTAGENLSSAILFMNSNKSEKNIRKKVDKTREKCLSHGIILGHDVVICKGPDRDVDRDAVNLLISFLMTGQYDMVAVDKLTDLTEDVSDMGRRHRLLMKIRRGDILYADLGGQYQGSMQGGMRPVVVVSDNMANKHSTVITVVPLSTKIFKKKNLPTHVFVSAYRAEGLEQHSIALCEQVTALDYGRIIENMGKVDEETLARITEAVQVQVGVYDKYNG